ncbi:MAG: pimeloyl-ACP methyl ester esterase BioH [Methylomicrobium sp.]
MTIHCRIYGEGEPVVLLHGWGMHGGIWRDFAERLAQTHRVVCVDLPGHGSSAEIPEFTLESVCDRLYAALGDTPACWLGWSMGGALALAMAKYYPETVASIGLVASNPCFIASEDWPGMSLSQFERFSESLSNDCESTLLRFLSLQVNGLSDFKKLSKKLSAAMRESRMPSERILQDGLSLLKNTDFRAVLADLRIPAIAFFGDQDRLVPVDVGAALQELNSQVRVSIVEGAGHAPFLSHRQTLTDALQQFLAGR